MTADIPTGPAAADDLGPIILEQKPKPLTADIFLALAILFLIPTAVVPFTADFRTGSGIGVTCGAAGVFFAVLGILYVLTSANKASVLHERGLRVRQGKAWRTVRYTDVTEMTFRATRMFHNGVYTGTVQEIALRTDDGTGKPLSFRHVYREKSGIVSGYAEATPLNRLCDVLTGLIARRMAARLDRGETVPWARGMSITPRGVEIRDRAGRRDEVDWERIARVDVDRGIFRLWVEGEQKQRAQCMVGEPNFFPGHVLVAQRLRSEPAQQPRVEVTDAAPPDATGGVTRAPSTPCAVRLEFAPTVEDHMALTRRWYERTPEGRRSWAGRVWALPGIVLAIAVLIGVINLFNKEIPEVHGAVAIMLAGGLVLRLVLGWGAPMLDRARLSRELRAAQQMALQGRGPDPFGPREALLGPEGYVLRTRYGEARNGWDRTSRAELYRGYVIVFLSGDRVRRESVGLLLPPRAFDSPQHAQEIYEQIEAWRRPDTDKKGTGTFISMK